MEGKGFKILLYYKYAKLDNPEDIISWHKKFLGQRGIKGRILIGQEGINGTLAGEISTVNEYITFMRADGRFSDIDFKETLYRKIPFPKLKVKYRKEIVTFGLKDDIDMTKAEKGRYLEPDEVQELVESSEEFYFVDARNLYESKIGKFKDAIIPDIENFRDFPKFLRSIESLKKKKLVFYCTGGVRCEKATAYARQEGFENVYHIKGGIQRYAEKYPKSAFEGSMYVFDDRIQIQFDTSKNRKILTECIYCDKKCDQYCNCYNPDCNKRIIACGKCYKLHYGFCSSKCKKTHRSRKDHEKFDNLLNIP